MWVHASCFLEFNPEVATPFLLMLRPRSGMQQWIAREQYTLVPSVPAVEFTDPFGNLCQRLVAPAGPFSIHTSTDIEAADEADSAPGAPFIEVQQLPAETLPFLLASQQSYWRAARSPVSMIDKDDETALLQCQSITFALHNCDCHCRATAIKPRRRMREQR